MVSQLDPNCICLKVDVGKTFWSCIQTVLISIKTPKFSASDLDPICLHISKVVTDNMWKYGIYLKIIYCYLYAIEINDWIGHAKSFNYLPNGV